MDKNKVLFKNTVLFAVGSFGSRVLSFILVPLYTHFLSTSEYGTADLIVTSYTVCMFIFSLSIFDAILPFVIQNINCRMSVLNLAKRIIVIGGLGFSLLVLIVLWGIIGLDICICLYMIIGYLFNSYNRLYSQYFQSINKIQIVVIGGVIQTVVILVSNIMFLVYFQWGFHGYIISILAGSCFLYLYQCFVLSDEKLSTLTPINNQLKKEIVLYSVPLIFNNVFWWINSSIDRYFISSMCGLDDNGIYSVASKIPSILTMSVSFFLQAWGMSAIKEFDPKDTDGFFSNTYNVFNSFVTVVASIIILFIAPIAEIMFAKEFFIAWKYAVVLLISTVFSLMSGFVGTIFSANKESKSFALSTVLAAIVNLIMNFLLIPKFGILGAGIATVLSFIVVWGVRIKKSYTFIRWKIPLIKHCLGYVLLCIQVIFSWGEAHNYLIQLMVFLIILSLTKKNIVAILSIIFNKLVGSR